MLHARIRNRAGAAGAPHARPQMDAPPRRAPPEALRNETARSRAIAHFAAYWLFLLFILAAVFTPRYTRHFYRQTAAVREPLLRNEILDNVFLENAMSAEQVYLALETLLVPHAFQDRYYAGLVPGSVDARGRYGRGQAFSRDDKTLKYRPRYTAMALLGARARAPAAAARAGGRRRGVPGSRVPEGILRDARRRRRAGAVLRTLLARGPRRGRPGAARPRGRGGPGARVPGLQRRRGVGVALLEGGLRAGRPGQRPARGRTARARGSAPAAARGLRGQRHARRLCGHGWYNPNADMFTHARLARVPARGQGGRPSPSTRRPRCTTSAR